MATGSSGRSSGGTGGTSGASGGGGSTGGGGSAGAGAGGTAGTGGTAGAGGGTGVGSGGPSAAVPDTPKGARGLNRIPAQTTDEEKAAGGEQAYTAHREPITNQRDIADEFKESENPEADAHIEKSRAARREKPSTSDDSDSKKGGKK